jgi:hypothetical protein
LCLEFHSFYDLIKLTGTFPAGTDGAAVDDYDSHKLPPGSRYQTSTSAD